MRYALLIAVLLASPSASRAAESVEIIGLGASSCATWLDATDPTVDYGSWILGMWTGVNALSDTRHDVGAGLDAAGIVNAVRARCQASPTERIAGAVLDVWLAMAKSGK